MLQRRRILVAAAVGALLATACGDVEGDLITTSDPTTASTTSEEAPTDDGPRAVTVYVDGEVPDANVALLAYFPKQVTVRAGDTVEFDFREGDPHTVSFGSLVDEAFGQMAAGEEPTTFGQIPFAFSDAGDAVLHGGALPCFTTDAPPTDGTPCEQVDQPAFDGNATLYASGLLEPGASFDVEVAEGTAPGTYNYLCLLHGPDMSGSITVVAQDGDGQSADDVAEAREAELEAAFAATGEVRGAIATGIVPGFDAFFTSGENVVVSGGGALEPVVIDILEFAPSDISVAAGGSVLFNMFGFHTVSFNATQDATPAIIPGDDGLPVINPMAFTPQGGAPGMPPPPEGDGGPPPDEEPAPQVIALDGGTYDGAGFYSSGVIVSFPPMLFSYEVTFSTAGTYPYQCLIHPGMEGSVTVT